VNVPFYFQLLLPISNPSLPSVINRVWVLTDSNGERQLDEREAITRLKRGDISGFETLVRSYQVKAVRTAYLITQDRRLAEDLVQAAFLRAYHRIDQFDATRPFAPWFMRSVANAAIQAAQRRERQLSLDSEIQNGDESITFADLIPDSAPGLDEVVERAEMQQAVWLALQKLSPEQRAAVVLRNYVGLGEDEMSAQMEIPPGTVKWRLHAARKQLKGLLDTFRVKPAPDWKEG
jgi:RNA polymerase sigma-70 factor, ECF subfamily